MDTVEPYLEAQRLELTRSSRDDGTVCLVVRGEVDVGTVEHLRATIGAILAEPGIPRLLLDLADLRFLDSSGIAALIGAQRAARRSGVRFGLVNCAGAALRVLENAGVYELLAGAGDE
jgi:anti-anti-sigma factor